MPKTVLTDDQLRLLGSELARFAAIYPFDIEAPKTQTLLLDTEWKVLSDGSLRIKQVRPFLK